MSAIRCTLLLAGCTALLMSTACQLSSRSAAAVTRRNPEAVLRAYFTAWNRNDSNTQKSLMTANYADRTWYPEPVESVELVSAEMLDEDSARLWSSGAFDTTRVYRVIFDYNPKGRGFSMERGRYSWTYTLIWDADRGSWLISNYGPA